MKKKIIKIIYVALLGIIDGLILRHYNLQLLPHFIGMIFMLLIICGTETIDNTIINK